MMLLCEDRLRHQERDTTPVFRIAQVNTCMYMMAQHNSWSITHQTKWRVAHLGHRPPSTPSPISMKVMRYLRYFMNLGIAADRNASLDAMWRSLCGAMWYSYCGTGYANPHAATQMANACQQRLCNTIGRQRPRDSNLGGSLDWERLH
jgi:hypothetical protein